MVQDEFREEVDNLYHQRPQAYASIGNLTDLSILLARNVIKGKIEEIEGIQKGCSETNCFVLLEDKYQGIVNLPIWVSDKPVKRRLETELEVELLCLTEGFTESGALVRALSAVKEIGKSVF
jgi:hypothetical protein